MSGGRTPWTMLRALADQPLPWADVHVVQGGRASGHTASLVPGDAVLDVTDADVATVGPSVAWDLVRAPRHLRRLGKVARLELESTRASR